MSYIQKKIHIGQTFLYFHKGQLYYNLPRKLKKAAKKKSRQEFRVTNIVKHSPGTHELTLKP